MHVCNTGVVGDGGAVAGARRVDVSAELRALGALPRVDYEDAFAIDTGVAMDRTGEEWARAILGGAPGAGRRLWSAVAALGVLPRGGGDGGTSAGAATIAGWQLRRSEPDFALLGAEARIGLAAELLFERRPGRLLFATFVHLDSSAARAAWAALAPVHRRVAPYLLERGA
jgi:Protein of unknown function (DUF2867)